MRLVSTILFAFGILATASGALVGGGWLTSGDRRHPVLSSGLTLGTPLRTTLAVEGGRRYTCAVQVLVERADLQERDGVLVVEAQFPLVATITNESGDRVAHVAGWLDPAEPPTTVYGHARAGVRAGPGASVPETIVERLVGPWPAGGRQTLTVAVDLGQDRVGKARIEGARLVVYDDAMPTSIKLAFGVLGAGALSIAIAMAFVGMGAGRALLSRRGGNRRRQIV